MKNRRGPGVDGMYMDNTDDKRLPSDILPDILSLSDSQAWMYCLTPGGALGKGEGQQSGYTLESRAVARSNGAGLASGFLRLDCCSHLLPKSREAMLHGPGRTTLEVDARLRRTGGPDG